MASLAGQVAVVTGASRGIGRDVAVHLARQGAAVAGIARPSADLASPPQAAGPAGDRVLAVPADVVSPVEVESAFDAAQARFGPATLVVACARTADVLGPLWAADPDGWWNAVGVDLRGTMLTARSAVRRMLAAGSGRLVTVYGNLGDRQLGNVSAFAAVKAGIARLTETLACELAGTSVRVLGVRTQQRPIGGRLGHLAADAGHGQQRRWHFAVVTATPDSHSRCCTCRGDRPTMGSQVRRAAGG